MKSKKAFMLGAAMAATCFVSAFALAEQYLTWLRKRRLLRSSKA